MCAFDVLFYRPTGKMRNCGWRNGWCIDEEYKASIGRCYARLSQYLVPGTNYVLG